MQGRQHRSPPCPGDSGRWVWPLCLHHLVRVRLRAGSSSDKLHTAAGSEAAVHFPDPSGAHLGQGPASRHLTGHWMGSFQEIKKKRTCA